MDYPKVIRAATEMIEGLGLDLTDPNLRETPERIARMLSTEFFAGVCLPEEITCRMFGKMQNLTTFPNSNNYQDIIMLDNIHFTSMCAHHFLPFSGKAWMLYIPDKKLVGASKPSRLIEYYSKRPQIQEHLTHDVIEDFCNQVEPLGAMLLMRGVHGCISERGVKQYHGAGMVTSAVRGLFLTDPVMEQKGLELIKLSLEI